MPLPLYGFVEGDTIGVVVVADERESVASLAEKLRDAASLRVRANGEMEILFRGAVLSGQSTLAEAGFTPFQRFDLRRAHGVPESRNGG